MDAFQSEKKGIFDKKFSLYKKSVLFLSKLIQPKSKNEDRKRREFILNIILAGSILLSFFAIVVSLIGMLIDDPDRKGLPIVMLVTPFVFSLILFYLSRKGYSLLASYLLVLAYFIIASATLISWSTILPFGLLIYALIVIMAGILINSRFALFATFFIDISLLGITYLQEIQILKPNLTWIKEIQTPLVTDVIVFTVIFIVIYFVSWLFNREIEKSLRRARKSETELKEERDFLEVRVEERTHELKQAQIEKMTQMDKFAEFGRLSSGLFHDLASPLTSISLNLSQLENNKKENLKKTKSHLQSALSASKKLERFIQAIKKQYSQQEQKENFSLNEEIENSIEILDFQARKEKINIEFTAEKEIFTYGNPLKFNQLITNLINNAIDAYDGIEKKNKKIIISLAKEKNNFIITVEDQASGIDQQNLEKIFEPLFTTKSIDKGTGIGLSTVKKITEQDFNGSIQVKSQIGRGSTFTIIGKIEKQYAKQRD